MKSWLAKQIVKNPKRLILINLFLSLLFSIGLKWLKIDDNFMNMLPDDIESRMVWEEIEDEFGASEIMLIAFGIPGKSIFTEDSFKKAWDFVHMIEKSPHVEEIISIPTLSRMDSYDGFIDVSKLQSERILSEQQIHAIKSYLNENPNIKSRVISKNGDFMSLGIRPKDGKQVLSFTRDIITVSDSLFKEYDIHYAGNSYLTGIVPEIVQEDISILMRIGISIMIVMLLANLRNLYAVLMIMLVIAISMLNMLGFMGWIYYLTGLKHLHFSLMYTSMPIILLTIANSDGVHLITHFFRELRKKGKVEDAIISSVDILFMPIFLTSFTTSIAFMTLISSPIKHMMGYGIVITFGILWAWILSVSLLPSLIILKKWNLNDKAISNKSYLEKSTEFISKKLTNKPKQILIFGLFTIFIISFGLWKVTIEVNVIKFFKENNPIRKSTEFIDNQLNGSMNLLFQSTGDMKDPNVLKDILKIQDKAESFKQSNTSISIANVIESMHKVVMNNDPKFEVIPENRGQINNLYTMYSMSGDPDDFNSLVDYEYKKGLITSMINSISTIESVEMVQELESFIKNNVDSELNVKISGMVVFLRDFVDLVVKSSLKSIGLSLFIIFIISWIFFNSFKWGLLSIIPLSSAIILNFGLMGHFNIHLSHMTALLTSIIIGVGVDFAVHYISLFRMHSCSKCSINEVSNRTIKDVGYPILLDVVSNMGFAALLFSALIPLNYIGGLMVFAMLSTSVGTFVLLATSVEIFKKHLYKN